MAKPKRKFNDHPFAYRQEIELEITTLTNLGVGLGRVALSPAQLQARPGATPPAPPADDAPEAPDAPTAPAEAGKWVVMVPFSLPGERVRVRVFRNHKNFSEADLLAVLTPSPDRIAQPPCPIFGQCGGCQYQHLTYTAQLAWKRRQVEELLQHMAGVTFPVSPVIGSPRQFGYRSKITPHFNPPRFRPNDAPDAENDHRVPTAEEMPIGFLRQGTRFDLLDVPHCLIATDAINARLPALRDGVRTRAATGAYVRASTLLLRDANGHVSNNYDEVITEEVAIDPAYGDVARPGTPAPAVVKLHFLARDFFQNNPFILPAFTGYVRAQAAASGARFLVDAYCGSGLFALTAAHAFDRVQGIEISESSIRFARENAAANGITNATFAAGDASAIFAGLTLPAAETVVVIDPPRKGCDESFLSQLFHYGPKAVVYVSCDPATQMRDLRGFLAAGYQLTAVQPFDLFPQTRHLECVITLRRE